MVAATLPCRSGRRITAEWRREEAEVRNEADTLSYSIEKFLRENEDKVSDDLKKEVAEAIADVKKKLEGGDTDAIRSSTQRLSQVSQKAGAAIYANAQAAQGDGASAGTSGDGGFEQEDEEVVDAEIVDEGKNRDAR
ncbi:MAG: Hsp70 family protein [Actinomadura rubrobrunea]|nr:Hsp70 family protein [Actinomadura rubrobrunea]